MEGVLKLNSVTIYLYSLLLAISFLWGSFVAYKKAIESHFEEVRILDTVVLSGFWSFVFGRVMYVLLNPGTFWGNWPRVFFLRNYPGLSHWGLLLGIFLAVWLATRKQKGQVFDLLDLAGLGLTGGMVIYFAGLVFSGSVFAVGAAVASLVVFSLLWKGEQEYRTYEWYKNKKTQARSGFITGVALSYYGLAHFAWQMASPDRKLVGIMADLLLFAGGWVIVYSRSGRSLSDDLKLIKRHGRKKE